MVIQKSMMRCDELSRPATCQLSTVEEVYLLKLISLHPWADMARLTDQAAKLTPLPFASRAASGRDKIAFCGYHGWHDWYLAANLGDEKFLPVIFCLV